MKKFLKDCRSLPERCNKPCKVLYEGESYTAFINGYSMVLTRERMRRIKLKETSWFEEFSYCLEIDGETKRLDIGKIISKAKKMGYVQKSIYDNSCFVCYKGRYYNLNVLLRAYSIIDNGEEAEIENNERKYSPLIIRTDIGMCCVLPYKYYNQFEAIVIDIE